MNTHNPRSHPRRNSGLLRRGETIVDGSAGVFAERGHHGASTQAIADVLGMRQASLYYYFPSKEAALELVCERGVDRFVESAEGICAGKLAPRDKLAALIASHLAPNATERDYVKAFISGPRYLPEASRRRIGRKSRRIERCFEPVIRAGIHAGSMRPDIDPHLTMLALLGMLNSVINWRARDAAAGAMRIAAEPARPIARGVAKGAATARRRRRASDAGR